MYENRASSCCIEARYMLGCFEPSPAPCRGFTGDCADLPAQFDDLGPQSPFDGYVCHQFPDPLLATLCPIPYKIVVSLIMVAVALPTRAIISRLFEVSNRPAGRDDSLWLRHLGIVKLMTGKVSWHYADRTMSTRTKYLLKYGSELDLMLFKVAGSAWRWLRRRTTPDSATKRNNVRTRPDAARGREARDVSGLRTSAAPAGGGAVSEAALALAAAKATQRSLGNSAPAGSTALATVSRSTAAEPRPSRRTRGSVVAGHALGWAGSASIGPSAGACSTSVEGGWLDRYLGGQHAARRARQSHLGCRVERAPGSSEEVFERTLNNAASHRRLTAVGVLFVYCSWAI